MALEIHILSLLAIVLAVYIMMRLRYTIFNRHLPALILFGITGIADTLATVQFAYLKPAMESNPITKLFLGIPYLIIVGVFLWTFIWISTAEFFERKNLSLVALLILLGLFIGHCWGFLSWLHIMAVETVIGIAFVTAGTLLLLYHMYVQMRLENGKKA